MSISNRCSVGAAQVEFCLALALLFLTTTFAAVSAPASAVSAAPKTHVLFMGADISLTQGKESHPVREVTASSLVIEPGGKRVEVPLWRSTDLFINESLKVAQANVSVENLKFERAYTPGADPFNKFSRAVSIAANESALSDVAQAGVAQASLNAEIAANSPPNPDTTALTAQTVANAVVAQNSANAALVQTYGPISQVNDVGSQANRMGVEESEQMFDAIRMSFEVKPEKDLTHAYYAVIAQIRDHDSKPGHMRKWAYVKALGAMSAGVATKVNIYQGGLPPGYILENCEVHLYDSGEELATSLSRKRVPLTDEEAFEYRIIEYVGANKGRTLAAVPAMVELTSEARATLTPAQLDENCYVRVAKDGRVTGVFRDAAGKQPLQDVPLESALRTVRFKPGLQTGKPVESIVLIKLGGIR